MLEGSNLTVYAQSPVEDEETETVPITSVYTPVWEVPLTDFSILTDSGFTSSPETVVQALNVALELDGSLDIDSKSILLSTTQLNFIAQDQETREDYGESGPYADAEEFQNIFFNRGGTEITLTKNVNLELTTGIGFSTPITINGNGKSAKFEFIDTPEYGIGYFVFVSSRSITIKNLNVELVGAIGFLSVIAAKQGDTDFVPAQLDVTVQSVVVSGDSNIPTYNKPEDSYEEIRGAGKVSITNCTFRDLYHSFNWDGYGCTDFIVENCLFENVPYTIVGGNSVKITNNTFNYDINGKSELSRLDIIDGTKSEPIMISGNLFSNTRIGFYYGKDKTTTGINNNVMLNSSFITSREENAYYTVDASMNLWQGPNYKGYVPVVKDELDTYVQASQDSQENIIPNEDKFIVDKWYRFYQDYTRSYDFTKPGIDKSSLTDPNYILDFKGQANVSNLKTQSGGGATPLGNGSYDIENGKDNVTFTATPDPGYMIHSVYAVDHWGETVPVRSLGNNQYLVEKGYPSATVYISASSITPVPTPKPEPEEPEEGENNGTIGEGDGFADVGCQVLSTGIDQLTSFNYYPNGLKTAITTDASGQVVHYKATIPSSMIDETETVLLPCTGIIGNIRDKNLAPIVTITLEKQREIIVILPIIEGTCIYGTTGMISVKDYEENTGRIVIEDGWIPINTDVNFDHPDQLSVPLSWKQTTFIVCDNSGIFEDMNPSMWSYNDVEFVSAREIMKGLSANNLGLFDPKATLIRGEVAELLWNFAGNPDPDGDMPYPAESNWWDEAVSWCVKNGIMTGYNPERFGAVDPTTREQFVTTLWRFLGRPEANPEILNSKSDADEISDFAVKAMAWAVELNLIGIDSPLDPKDNITREQTAAIMERMIRIIWGRRDTFPACDTFDTLCEQKCSKTCE